MDPLDVPPNAPPTSFKKRESHTVERGSLFRRNFVMADALRRGTLLFPVAEFQDFPNLAALVTVFFRLLGTVGELAEGVLRICDCFRDKF